MKRIRQASVVLLGLSLLAGCGDYTSDLDLNSDGVINFSDMNMAVSEATKSGDRRAVVEVDSHLGNIQRQYADSSSSNSPSCSDRCVDDAYLAGLLAAYAGESKSDLSLYDCAPRFGIIELGDLLDALENYQGKVCKGTTPDL